MEEAITSSQLEGAVTTREVAKEMLGSGRTPKDKSEQMILNNYRTMRRIRDPENKVLSPELVYELHRMVTDETLDDTAAGGRLRRTDELITVEDETGEVMHVPPPASELPARLEAMCAFANGEPAEPFIHPAIRAMISLLTETDKNDLAYRLLHQSDVIRKAIASLHDCIRFEMG